jgi:hypothetical protein
MQIMEQTTGGKHPVRDWMARAPVLTALAALLALWALTGL